MRLTLKLTTTLTAILIVQFALYGYLAARRLTVFFERDLERDGFRIGRTLSTAVARTWETQGQDAALELVSATNRDYTHIQIRFVRLIADAPPRYRPELPLMQLTSLESENFVAQRAYPEPESDYIYTYTRVPLDREPRGAIEIKQSFAPENWFTTVSVLRVVAFLLIVVVTTALVMLLLGSYFVGRRIERLCCKARQIARGELSEPIRIDGNDEISVLAREINSMSEALEKSSRRLQEETAARIDAMERLRHADRLTALGTLASGIAHELGTPLTVAQGHLKTLSALSSDTEVQRLRGALSDQLERMIVIVRHVLDYSRRRRPNKRLVDLQDVLRRVVEMLAPFGRKRSISIRYEPNVESAITEADGPQLEQVFTNLIVNAIQASDCGEIEVGVACRETLNPEAPQNRPELYLCVYVMDSGSGMSEEEAKRIFEPFYTTKSPGHGTGMGLSIAHGIVREHMGWIEVVTGSGKGSCFSVYLPTERTAA